MKDKLYLLLNVLQVVAKYFDFLGLCASFHTYNIHTHMCVNASLCTWTSLYLSCLAHEVLGWVFGISPLVESPLCLTVAHRYIYTQKIRIFVYVWIAEWTVDLMAMRVDDIKSQRWIWFAAPVSTEQFRISKCTPHTTIRLHWIDRKIERLSE